MSVIHVSYLHERYESAPDCIDGIRKRIQLGWQVSQIRGPRSGPFVVLFRIDDTEDDWKDESETPEPVGAAAGE